MDDMAVTNIDSRSHSRRILRAPHHRRATWWNEAIGKAQRTLRSSLANFLM